MDDLHAHPVEPLHHMTVVDNRAKGLHLAAVLGCLLHHIHRAIDAKAEAGILSQMDIHTAIRSRMVDRTAATVSSRLHSELSSRIASFA